MVFSSVERLNNGVCWLVRLVGAGRYGAPGLGNKNREYLFFLPVGILRFRLED
jgi:hypothetical protein